MPHLIIWKPMLYRQYVCNGKSNVSGMSGYLSFKGAPWIVKTVYQGKASISYNNLQVYNLPETLYQRIRVDRKRAYR